MAGSKVSIYEVARRAGVSTATVSRVAHDGRGFSEATRKAVQAAMEELHWVPSGAARALAARRTGVVGLLFADLGKAAEEENEALLFVDQVIRGAERAATLAGGAVLVAATRGRTGRQLAWSLAGRVDGMVVVAGSLPERDLRRLARSVPVVVLAAGPMRGGLDVVSADGRTGIRELTTHLVVDHGYRDLCFLGGPDRSPDARERFVGYGQARADAGLDPVAVPDGAGDFTEAGGAAATATLLERRGAPPRALLAANDEMAIGAMRVLRERGLRVPLDVAVTGFDDITSTRYLHPPLTTVRQPMRAIGEQAVTVLLERLRDPDGLRRDVLMPTEVVLRRSCGCRPAHPASPRHQRGRA